MAGYQDQLIGPAPYVETIPVDAYTRVGMIKQKQYDEGVQKVQGYIDSVAGIEALMPEQKDYLNKTVNQLQSQVQQIAGADFSNQQIVNSVGHLTKQMAADPIIQNTVYATNAYKNESAKMKMAQDQGKSSPANEFVFQDGVQKWLGSHDPSKSFDASYTPYTDYKGKMLKALNTQLAKSPDEWVTEMPYKRGGDGKPLVDEHGMPMIDYNTLLEKYKGVNAERIKNIVESTLDDNDKQQIAIDGRYEYRGADKNAMKDLTDRSYQARLDRINGAIDGIRTKRSVSQDNPQALKDLNDQEAFLQNSAKDLQNSYLGDINSINNNVEGYKSALYGKNWLSQFSEGYSFAQHSLTYVDNPAFKNALAEKELAQKWEEFKWNKQFQLMDLDIKRQDLELRRNKQKKEDGEDVNYSSVEPIDNPDKSVALDEFTKNVNDQKTQSDLLDMSLLATKKPELVERRYDKDGNAYFVWAGNTPDEQKKNSDAGAAAISTYRMSDGTGDPDIEDWKNKTQSLQANYKAGMKVAADAQDQADLHPDLNLDQQLKAIPNFTVADSRGNRYTLSNKDLLDFNKAEKDIMQKSDISITTGGGAWLDSILSNKVSSDALNNMANNTFNTPATRAVWEAVKRYKDNYPNVNPEDEKVVQRLYTIENLGRDIATKRQTFTTNVLKNVLPAFQPVATPLTQFKGPDKKAADRWVTEQLVGLGGKANTGLNFNESDVNKMLGKANIENTGYYIIDRGDGKFSLRISNPDVIGSKKMEIDLPRQSVENLFGGEMGVDIFKNIRDMQRYSTLSNGPITTNVLRQGATTATPLKNGNTTLYKVKYDVERASSGQGHQIRLYTYNTVTKENQSVVLNPRTMLSESQVIAALQHLSDDTIKTALANQPSQ